MRIIALTKITVVGAAISRPPFANNDNAAMIKKILVGAAISRPPSANHGGIHQ